MVRISPVLNEDTCYYLCKVSCSAPFNGGGIGEPLSVTGQQHLSPHCSTPTPPLICYSLEGLARLPDAVWSTYPLAGRPSLILGTVMQISATCPRVFTSPPFKPNKAYGERKSTESLVVDSGTEKCSCVTIIGNENEEHITSLGLFF